jgi:P-type Cu+ transporter
MFCCAGCESVYKLLESRGLLHYYQLRDQASFAPPRPVAGKPLFDPAENENLSGLFLLEGLHCLGCLWLLEKLPELEGRISKVALDMGQSTLRVQRSSTIQWREVTALLASLGYGARLIESALLAQEQEREERRQLWRVALAGFATGNIMTWSAALYAGADASWAGAFSYLSAAFGIPVVTYCAWPIYRSGFRPLLNRTISLDLPIALAIFAGSALSFWRLFTGSTEHYFDSLSMLVFLLLASRYYLLRTQKKYAHSSRFLRFIEDDSVQRVSPEAGPVRPSMLKVGDVFVTEPGKILACDARAREKTGLWDYSHLTGESLPLASPPGELVESGAKNAGEPIEMIVERPSAQSRMQTLLNQIEAFAQLRSPSLAFTQKLAPWFSLGVLMAAGAAFLLGFASGGPTEGLSRFLALVVVTCPCVLAFVVPLTLSMSMERGARMGILIKEAGSLERLAECKVFCFDKTGTLTMGQFSVFRWEGNESDAAWRALWSLENGSQHPVGRALFRLAQSKVNLSNTLLDGPPTQLDDGVRATIGGKEWSVRRVPGCPGENSVGLFCQGEIQLRFALGDRPRSDSRQSIEKLRSLGARIVMLTGDTAANSAPLAADLGISEWEAALTPDKKALRLASMKTPAMIGDGANDAAAFRAANVGIAVQGAMAQSLQHADMALTVLGLKGLVDVWSLAKKTRRLIRINFAMTLTYNLIAGTLAFSGHMNPLLAAVLMPMSAATVFLFTQWHFQRELR